MSAQTDRKKKMSGEVLVSAAYSTACFTAAGEQIPELQKGLLELWAEHAERLGYDPSGVVFRTPGGRWSVFRTPDGGWNWESADDKRT